MLFKPHYAALLLTLGSILTVGAIVAGFNANRLTPPPALGQPPKAGKVAP